MYNKSYLLERLNNNKLPEVIKAKFGITCPKTIMLIQNEIQLLINKLTDIDGELMKNEVISLLNKIASDAISLALNPIGADTFSTLTALSAVRNMIIDLNEHWGHYTSTVIVNKKNLGDYPAEMFDKFKHQLIIESVSDLSTNEPKYTVEVKKSYYSTPHLLSRPENG